jgi:peptide/nickel transport system substrate-binding protein
MRSGMRILVILAVVCMIGFGQGDGLVGAASKRGGEIKVGTNADVSAVDPHVSTSVPNAVVLNHIFEPLVCYGDKLDFVPVLAERWEISSDYKTYTFYLRKNRLFHNGREMVAEDVKYSIERVMDPKTGCPFRSHFGKIESIEVVDKYTVRFHMKESNAGLLSILAYEHPRIAVIPKEEVEKQGGVFNHPVGTGPYAFVEWKPDRYVLVERFEKYQPLPGPMNGMGGARIPYVDKIKFIPIGEKEVATMALLNKEIDFLLQVPFKSVEKFRKEYSKKGIVIEEIPGLAFYQIFFGFKKPITKDVNFRKACAYAIDRDMVAKAATRGYCAVNSSFVAVKNQYHTPYHDTWYKKDIPKAKALLEASGYNGEEVILYTSKKYPMMYDQALAVQSELATLGVKIKLEVVDLPVLIKKFTSGDYQMLSFGLGAKPNPNLAYIVLKMNGFLAENPRMRELMGQASKTLDFETRKKAFEECHRLVYENVPAIGFYNYNYFNAYHSYLKGFKILPTNMPRFWGVWLEK